MDIKIDICEDDDLFGRILISEVLLACLFCLDYRRIPIYQKFDTVIVMSRCQQYIAYIITQMSGWISYILYE